MPKNARVTDICDHGPQIITGAEKEICENQRSSRIGDIYNCPEHGPNPIVSGSPNVYVQGARTARIGDVTACGAVIITGAQRHIVN